MTGFLSKSDLRQLTGAARQGNQVDWLRRIYVGYNHDRQPAERDRAMFDPFLILPTTQKTSAGELPARKVCGVYALFNSDGGVSYVGQSENVGARVFDHMKAKGRKKREPFASYGFVEVPQVLRLAVEIAHIYALEPQENKAFHVPCWAFHNEAVRVLRAAWGKKQ